MDIALWTAQVLLAIVFAGSGVAKSTMSKDRLLATGQTGVATFPMPVVRFTAAMELLAAVGLILPWATGIAHVLTPAAAVGLGIVMVGAAGSHIRLGELRNVAANGVLFALCLFVAISRFGQL
ncbi:MAG: DoxX family protein [Acidimicrobiales bacterium]